MSTRTPTQTSPYCIGIEAGMHPDDAPGYDDQAQAVLSHVGEDLGTERRSPSSVRRYLGNQTSTQVATRQMIRVTYHGRVIPARASAQPGNSLLAAPTQQHSQPHRRAVATRVHPEPITHPEPAPTAPARPTRRMHQRHPHWFRVNLTVIGIVLVLMLVGWALLSMLFSWAHTASDDWRYGRPRTTQLDAVVGGGDSAANPTHFVAINNRGRVVIIEEHAGDPNRVSVLQVPLRAALLDPVLLQVTDINHDGKPDLVVQVENSVHVLVNDGHGTFGAPKPGDRLDTLPLS